MRGLNSLIFISLGSTKDILNKKDSMPIDFKATVFELDIIVCILHQSFRPYYKGQHNLGGNEGGVRIIF